MRNSHRGETATFLRGLRIQDSTPNFTDNALTARIPTDPKERKGSEH